MILHLLLTPLYLSAPPPPAARPGFQLGTPGTRSRFQLFIDPHCPSSAAFFPLFLKAISLATKDGDAPIASKLDIRLHIYPLPYHYYAFSATLLAHFIAKKYPTYFTDFLNLQLSKLDKYNGEVKADLATVRHWLEEDVYQVIKVRDDDVPKVWDDKELKEKVDLDWKVAPDNRIPGTATGVMNGVNIGDLPLDVGKIQELLKKYI